MIAVCRTTCDAPSDCVPASASAFNDEDNWACESNLCVYLGCSAGECETVSNLACVDHGFGFDLCAPSCGTPVDCAPPGSPAAFDADNYECVDGGCKYAGCNDDAECASLGNYVCRSLPGAGLQTCVLACEVPGDCADPQAGPAYDADNYACEDGACRYTGCNDTAECIAGLDPSSVCE